METRQGIELEHLSNRDLLVLAVQSINEVKASQMNQEKRIRELESWRWAISGGLTVLVFIVVVFGVFIIEQL